MPEADDVDHGAFDRYITAQVMLPVEGEMHIGTVRKRKLDANGVPIGKSHSNPILDDKLDTTPRIQYSRYCKHSNTVPQFSRRAGFSAVATNYLSSCKLPSN